MTKQAGLFILALFFSACDAPKQKIEQGYWVTLHYRLTLADGTTRVDESQCNTICPKYPAVPLKVKAGCGWLVPAWDRALIGMQQGETKTIKILPEEGWGQHPPQGLNATDTLRLTIEVTSVTKPTEQ